MKRPARSGRLPRRARAAARAGARGSPRRRSRRGPSARARRRAVASPRAATALHPAEPCPPAAARPRARIAARRDRRCKRSGGAPPGRAGAGSRRLVGHGAATPRAIASRRATRSSVDGWVENILARPEPKAASGLTCASGATAGGICIGMRCAAASSLRSALASASGLPESSAPDAVGRELALPADRELDQHRGERREHDHATGSPPRPSIVHAPRPTWRTATGSRPRRPCWR